MSNLILKSLMLSLFLFTSAVVDQSAAALFPQSSTWQRFKAEGFSVLLPEHPTTMEIARPSKMFEPQRTARLFSAYEDSIAYVILALDNPNHRDPLSRFIDDIEKYNVSGKAQSFRQDLRGAGFTGKEYGFGHGSVTGVVRFYLTADRAYIVEAVGDDVSKASVKQFLDSFVIGNDDRARNISPAEPVYISREVPDIAAQPNVEIFKGKDVTSKARVLVKPEPMYTETARQAQTVGTVVLRGIFTSTGHVINLREVSGLPNGLTERAIEAAQNIKFIPAMKDERHVSMYIQLEYNFNLY